MEIFTEQLKFKTNLWEVNLRLDVIAREIEIIGTV